MKNPLVRYFVSIILAVALAINVNSSYAKDDSCDSATSYSVRSLKGDYGYAIDGVIVNANDSSTTPAAAVGQFHADGKGNIVDAVRILNQGGTVIEQVLTGTYTVSPDGTGEITVHASNLLADGTTVPATIETASFVINQPNNELQLIGTSIIGPTGEDLGLLLTTRGVARMQKKSSSGRNCD